MKNLLVLIILFLFFPAFSFSETGEETAGRAAEQAGKLREALTHYVAALQGVPERSADDQRLRETIIQLVQKLSPPPAVPEEATRFSVRGQIAIQEAKSAADFDEAAREFGKALRVAPWWADGYINQGVALEKAGRFNEAARALKSYLLAAPNAPDKQNVKNQIYALEYRQEKAQKEAVARKEEEDRKRREEAVRANDPLRLAGDWCYLPPNGQVACGYYKMLVSGNSFEIWGGGWREFRGTVAGDEIAGSHSPLIFQKTPCTAPSMPMQGRVTPGGNRIELSYTHVSGMNERSCAVTHTRPERIVLVRQQ